MTAPAARPDADTLRKYNRGLLSPREVAAVEAWMAENSRAADLLDEAAGRDSVIDALNDTGASGNTPAGTNVQHGQPKIEMALPDAIGGYRVLREMGRGGMGVVYEAVDAHLKRRVAVKLIAAELAANAAARERFLREAQAVARIDHPNVVPVHSSGEDHGQLFLVMPLLKGETLESRLKRERKLPPAEVARIGREVAAGLEAAHAVGLIHRDIKPGNIWLEADTGRVRILDFGLAKPLTDAAAGLTETGVIVGTPHYMAPEQAEGHSVDSRTDLFSLGAVLYHAATGERPFKGQTSLAVLIAVKVDTPPSIETLSPDLPPHLASVIHKLLAKTAADRPTSATEVIESLSGVTAAPTSPFAALNESGEIVRPKPAPTKKLPTRWKRAATAAGLVFAAVALVVAAIVVIIYDKDGNEVARINVPGGKAKIQRDGDEEAPVGPSLALLTTLPLPDPTEKEARSRSMAFSPDGKRLLAAMGNTVVQWDVSSRKKLWSFQPKGESKPEPANVVALSPDGTRAFCGGGHIPLQIVNAKTGDEIRTLAGRPIQQEVVFDAVFLPDNRQLLVSHRDRHEDASWGGSTIRLWDTETGKEVRSFIGHKSWAHSISLTADGKQFASSGLRERFPRLWVIDKKEAVHMFQEQSQDGSSVALTFDGERLAASCTDGVVRLWQINERAGPQLLRGHDREVRHVRFTSDGKYLYSSDMGKIILWNGVTGTKIKEWDMPSYNGYFTLSRDDKLLAVGNKDGTIAIYQVSGLK